MPLSVDAEALWEVAGVCDANRMSRVCEGKKQLTKFVLKV